MMSRSRMRAFALIAIAAATAACVPATTEAPATDASARSQHIVRAELEQAYERNRQALLARDVAAVLALRAPGFHVVTPDGVVHDAREMEAFSRNLLENLVRWDALSFDIVSIEDRGDEVSAEIRQHSSRTMRREGGVRQVENWVTQRETWVRTADGWRVLRVDNIRDQRVLIDGVPRS